MVFVLLWIVYNLDPYASNGNMAYFYATAFLLSFCAAFQISFWSRRWLGKRELLRSHFSISARQSLWMAFIIAFGLLLSSSGIFNLLNGLVLVGMFVFLEAYFLYSPRQIE